MSVELEELFHDLDPAAPTMSVSADSVVASGQRKVRRRRALWGAGTGALAAAAAVAIAVGTALPDSSSPSPMPAHSSTPPLGQFFQRDGDDAGLPRDEVTSTPMGKADGKPATPSTTYQVYRKDGVLRIRRIDKTGSVDLPEVAQYKDGGSATNDRDQTVIVRPVPADTDTADLWIDPRSDYSMLGGAGVVLPDGTPAAVFWTGQRIDAAKYVGYASWWTTAGTLHASNGATATLVPLTTTAGSATTFWSFESLGTCGVRVLTKGGTNGGTNDVAADGVCATTITGGAPAHQVVAILAPGPVTKVTTTATTGGAAPALHTTPVGDGHVLMWLDTTEVDHLPFREISWTSPDGKRLTWPQQ
ncbi:hypothetical protein ATK17_2647 [Branchiibius hedensis]|uniref:Uncharacterized protein n=1 Tax=Branchiibius hedensis TaxID=672460 RepID=A0A2Y8ZUW8_9MICO|nr:hypothetical protein [Branchiibius hedensis]PWJ26484.1 hypothetical protein ATK17_2647 [Branchiibius hedensis]SSA35296.1 hypothetical protein SAMN04489750_2647 [Branchiibius hedensis]